MLLLAFDTATPAITVAVHDGTDVLAAVQGEGAMAHGELLSPFIDAAMTESGRHMHELTDIAVGVGPGPFTGLRVGVVTALTLGSTCRVRTHGICTLDIIAAQVDSAVPFVVASDARRKEVYWAEYDRSGLRIAGPDVARPAALAERWSGPVYGRGAHRYADTLRAVDGPMDPAAADLARLVVEGRVPTLPLEPLYLRRPDAMVSSGIKRA